MKSRSRELDLVVWERGCGITLACGTGACATTVAAILTGRCDDTVRVNLPGGPLSITVRPDNVLMRGPAAARSFDGELDFQPRYRDDRSLNNTSAGSAAAAAARR